MRRRGRYRCIIIQQILPFASEILQSRDILLPRLHIRIVIFDIHIIIVILIRQSAETVAELMDDDRPELAVLSRGQCIGIVYPSASGDVSVGQYDYML